MGARGRQLVLPRPGRRRRHEDRQVQGRQRLVHLGALGRDVRERLGATRCGLVLRFGVRCATDGLGVHGFLVLPGSGGRRQDGERGLGRRRGQEVLRRGQRRHGDRLAQRRRQRRP